MNDYDQPPRDPGEPQVRLRFKHTRTAKDGWRLDETTVEITSPLTDTAGVISRLLEGYAGEVYLIGAREAKRRNQEEYP